MRWTLFLFYLFSCAISAKRPTTNPDFVAFWDYFGRFSTSKCRGHVDRRICPLHFESKIDPKEPKNRQKLGLWSVSKEPRIKKITYSFSSEPIDVVIPCTPKDQITLELCIDGIKKNGKNIRRIIVLSKEKMSDSAEWFCEDLFPFSKREIALEIYKGNQRKADEFLSSPKTRIGWIYQQFLKFYTPFVIPHISANVLILDSDVVFLKPVDFMTSSGEPYFIPATEYYSAYFEHAARLLPGLKKVNSSQSGIAHHMLFQRPVLEDLFRLVSRENKTEFWKALCRCIDLKEIYGSCMSEYEIYFNFIQLRSNQARINPAKWSMIHHLQMLEYYKRSSDVFVVIPEWFRKIHGQNE